MIDESKVAQFDGPLIAGRYKLGPLLGKGSQGATYMARDRQTDQVVAVKEFSLDQAADWKQFELFQRGCEVLQDLDHPGIPNYIDQFRSEDDTHHYLIMEFIPGESLKDIVRNREPLEEPDLWRILIQMVDILSHLHSHDPPIVHRDIKPGNLVQRANGEIFLVDFGGVRKVISTDAGSTVVGTFGYMAPELLHGRATPASDLYSLGATLVHLGTGMEPEDLPRQGLKVDFSEHLDISPNLAEILEDILEPDPDKRPASAVELKEYLWAAVEKARGLPAAELLEEPIEAGMPAESRTFETRRVDLPMPAEAEEPPRGFPALAEKIPAPLALIAGVLMVIVGIMGNVALWTTGRILVPVIFAILSLFTRRAKRPSLRQTKRSLQDHLDGGRPLFRRMTEQGKIEFNRGREWLETPGPPRRPPSLTGPPSRSDRQSAGRQRQLPPPRRGWSGRQRRERPWRQRWWDRQSPDRREGNRSEQVGHGSRGRRRR